jgi:NCAIR mutase (PurE)-related protein
MEDILRELHGKRITLDEAISEMNARLIGSFECNIDPGREGRTGCPEIVISEGKTVEQLISISEDFLKRARRVIISRLDPVMADQILSKIGGVIKDYDPVSRVLTIKAPGYADPPRRGKVGILTAGTSDIPIASEAERICRELGCETLSFHDVGVAGIHRLLQPLKMLGEFGPDVLIVAAGREGALPTVIAGLTDVPVIGLPVSTGYGIHPKGETALFAMLQSCSPIAVVNIDAGVVAGIIASRIARRAHQETMVDFK